jgi:hypothetical protein
VSSIPANHVSVATYQENFNGDSSPPPRKKRRKATVFWPDIFYAKKHERIASALTALEIVKKKIEDLRKWEWDNYYLQTEVNIFLDIDDTVIEHGSDSPHKAMNYLGGRRVWHDTLNELKTIPWVHVYALTAMGIEPGGAEEFNSHSKERALAFKNDDFPFTREKMETLTTMPFQTLCQREIPS